MTIPYSKFVEIAENSYNDYLKNSFTELNEEKYQAPRAVIERAWEGWIFPSLMKKAKTNNWTINELKNYCYPAVYFTVRLFNALHNYGPFTVFGHVQPKVGEYKYILVANDRLKFEEVGTYWEHQNYNFLPQCNSFHINKNQLLEVASEYLAHSEFEKIRTNKFDWLLLDSMVLAMLHELTYAVAEFDSMSTKAAKEIAKGDLLKYAISRFFLMPLNFIFNFVLKVLLPLMVVWFLLIYEYTPMGWILVVLWIAGMTWWFLALLDRWKARRKLHKILGQVFKIYTMLNQIVISPRLLKEAFDKLVAEDFICYGAVFGIVDRLVTKDATAFFPDIDNDKYWNTHPIW
jgi:hypothetical protein